MVWTGQLDRSRLGVNLLEVPRSTVLRPYAGDAPEALTPGAVCQGFPDGWVHYRAKLTRFYPVQLEGDFPQRKLAMGQEVHRVASSTLLLSRGWSRASLRSCLSQAVLLP